MTAVQEQIDRQRGRTFTFDRPPLWTAMREGALGPPLLESMLESHRANVRTITQYVEEEGERIALQLGVFAALLALALALRRQARQWAHEDE